MSFPNTADSSSTEKLQVNLSSNMDTTTAPIVDASLVPRAIQAANLTSPDDKPSSLTSLAVRRGSAGKIRKNYQTGGKTRLSIQTSTQQQYQTSQLLTQRLYTVATKTGRPHFQIPSKLSLDASGSGGRLAPLEANNQQIAGAVSEHSFL
jgi:hypothetical protein